MIDKEILDAVIPVPTLEEAKDEKVAELKEEGFVVTNFHSGGVFYTLLMVELRIKIELLQLARRILNNMFVTHAEGVWLDLKMPDYSKKRKKAQKAQGLVTVSRVGASGEAIKIAKGHVFKSILDINGEELRYFTIEAAVLQKGAMSVDVLVEAEAEGSRYNVPEGQITRTLTYIGDVKITNAADWIVREGSDTEDDESARARTLRSWSELAQLATEDAFVNAAESVTGVLFAQADCDHPRGQGTVDIIVTGTAGEATEGLLKSVQEAVDKIAGPYDNILVKSSVTVDQDIELTITTGSADSDEDIENRVKTTPSRTLRATMWSSLSSWMTMRSEATKRRSEKRPRLSSPVKSGSRWPTERTNSASRPWTATSRPLSAPGFFPRQRTRSPSSSRPRRRRMHGRPKSSLPRHGRSRAQSQRWRLATTPLTPFPHGKTSRRWCSSTESSTSPTRPRRRTSGV